MKTNFTDINDLLVKLLTHEASEEEQAFVQQWLAASPDNRKHFEHFRLIWEESRQLAATTLVDEEAAWLRFRQRITEAPPRKSRLLIFRQPWMRIAAILVLIAGIAWLSLHLLTGNSATDNLATFQTGDNIKTDTLPDGSIITLNKNSLISYPEAFAHQQRSIRLEGEAFFNVTPDKSKPFTVKTGDVNIRVVGTSFNIRNRADSIEVIVETGIVEVTAAEETITLRAGEKTVIAGNAKRLHKQQVQDQLHRYYRNKVFVCDNTPLWRLVAILNEAYDARIIIERNDLRNLPLTTTFTNESLENILMIVKETFGITIAKENGQIILR